MNRFAFTYHYDPSPDKGNLHRVAKTADQVAEALRDFPEVLAYSLHQVDATAEVLASPEQAVDGEIPVSMTTTLTENELYEHTKKAMNYLDLYGTPIKKLG